MSWLDVVDTQRLIIRRRWPLALGFVLVYITFVLALGALNASPSIWENTFLLLGLIVGPGLLPITLLAVCFRLRRQARDETGIFARTRSTISEVGINAVVGGRNVEVRWSAFSAFAQSDRVILLFLKDTRDHLIVARSKLVDPTDWARLSDFLRSQFSDVG